MIAVDASNTTEDSSEADTLKAETETPKEIEVENSKEASENQEEESKISAEESNDLEYTDKINKNETDHTGDEPEISINAHPEELEMVCGVILNIVVPTFLQNFIVLY